MEVPISPPISVVPPPRKDSLLGQHSLCSPRSVSSYDDEVSCKIRNLTSPPSSQKQYKSLSPLRPPDCPVTGKGLERQRFEALLQASRERQVALGSRKTNDLRKEIALKAHKNKQVQRRALFLSKVHAQPSPAATFTPKTPPDSPSIFHFSLPSPGLISPLVVFDSFDNDPVYGHRFPFHEPWVEQVDFRMNDDIQSKKETTSNASFETTLRSTKRSKKLPSLDEISVRMSSHDHTPSALFGLSEPNGRSRLPSFFTSPREEPAVPRKERPGLPGFLKRPVKDPAQRPTGVPDLKVPPAEDPMPGPTGQSRLPAFLKPPAKDPPSRVADLMPQPIEDPTPALTSHSRLPAFLKAPAKEPPTPVARRSRLPAFLTSQVEVSASLKPPDQPLEAPEPTSNTIRSSRLPAFLTKPTLDPNLGTTTRTRPPIEIGRLKIPIRAPQPTKAERSPLLSPLLPPSPQCLSPKIKITTTVVPRYTHTSPIELSESNLNALNQRQSSTNQLLSTLKRRLVATSDHVSNGHDEDEDNPTKRRSGRHSAPAELTHPGKRSGFQHPATLLAGGF